MKTYLQSTLIFCKTANIFNATKENNVAQFKVKVESMNSCAFQNVLINSYQIALSSQFV